MEHRIQDVKEESDNSDLCMRELPDLGEQRLSRPYSLGDLTIAHTRDSLSPLSLASNASYRLSPERNLQAEISLSSIVEADRSPAEESETALGLFSRAQRYLEKYESSSAYEDLELATSMYRDLLARTIPGGPLFRSCQSALCRVLTEMYMHTGDEIFLSEAIVFGEGALTQTHDALSPEHNLNLSTALITRYLHFRHTGDLDRALSLVDSALEPSRGTSTHVRITTRLAQCLRVKSISMNNAEAVERAINIMLELAETGDSLAVAELVACLHQRYQRKKDPITINDAVDRYFRALEALFLSTRDRAAVLSALSMSLVMRYQDQSNPEDLKLAILYGEDSLNLMSVTHVLRPAIQLRLGYLMEQRYAVLGDSSDLDNAIQTMEAAAQAERPAAGNYGSYYHALTIAYEDRFHLKGHVTDLDHAVRCGRRCVEVTPRDRMNYAELVSLLSTTLWLRYKHFRHDSDLTEYVTCASLAVEHMPDAHHSIQRVCLSTLGTALTRLFEHNHDVGTLDAGIGRLRQALNLRTAEAEFETYETDYNLGEALIRRAELRDSLRDWHDGIHAHRKGLETLPQGHFHRPRALAALAIGLRKWFIARPHGDMQEALRLHEEVLELRTPGFPDRAEKFQDLGETFLALYNAHGGQEHLNSAIRNFQLAAEDKWSFINHRFQASVRWAQASREDGRMGLAMEGYSQAVNLLPRLAWVGMAKKTRLQELQRKAVTLAVDAAATAIEAGALERAVELLEASRGVLWTQMLALRTRTDELATVAPGLAGELESIGRLLDSDRGSEQDDESEEDLRKRRRLAERWEEVVGEVRKLNGFEMFLAAPTFSQLRTAACGPIAIINASQYRCDILIVTQEHAVQHIPLPSLSVAQICGLYLALAKALSGRRDRARQIFLEDTVSDILDHLWTTLGSHLCSALSNLYPPGGPRRLYLCPTGVASLLPIHAAMPQYSGVPGLPDRICCSYTASVSALLHPQWNKFRRAVAQPRILAISVPTAPGYEPLPSANLEMEAIRDCSIGTHATFISGPDASISQVCQKLKEHEWMHIATHGRSEPHSPMDSCFQLYDGPLNLSTMSGLHLPQMEFAFLSACHTARNSGHIPDESLTLATGLQIAGVNGIVATMWAIADKDAPDVARIVYAHMTCHGRAPDHRDAAEGLRLAIAELRRRRVPAARWVPFIHIGI